MTNFFNLTSQEAKFLSIRNIQEPRLKNFEYFNTDISAQDCTVIDAVLQERIANMRYDRIGIIYDFLNFYLEKKIQDPKTKPIEVLSDFFPDYSKPIYSKGSACVGLTLDLYNSLPKHLYKYVVAARLHKHVHQFAFPEYCHTAIVIPYYYKNSSLGYILLDTSFDIPFGINLNSENPIKKINMGTKKGIWTFSLNSKSEIICHTSQDNFNDDNYNIIFYLKELLNPIESSAIPMFVADRELVLLRRNKNGEHYGNIKIELNKRRIVSTLNNVRNTPIYYECISKGKQIFPHEIYTALSLEKNELDDIIYKIIDNVEILNDLYISYLQKLLILSKNKDKILNLNITAV